jgi:antitoxin HicB
MYRYSIIITPDDGRYSVTVPSLPGCFTWGDTVEEAVANARDAIAVHVAGLEADGEDVPAEAQPPFLTVVEVEAHPEYALANAAHAHA